MFDIINKTRIKPPISGIFLKKIKDEILGPKYDISLVFAKNSLSKNLNSKYRGKNHPTNVLSFPLSENSGEIFMDISKIKNEAKIYKISIKTFFSYLYMHSLLHLKGMNHSKKMTEQEIKNLNEFGIEITPDLQKFLV